MAEFSPKLFISVALLLLLLLPISSLSAHNSSIYQLICNKNFTTTNNNILQINIKNTIASLAAKTSNNTFAISSYGVGYNTIYGLFQCRGDSSNQLCSSCITKAVHQIRTICPYSAESRIWYPFCFLRYDNYKFFGQADSSYTRVWPSPALITAQNPEPFNSALGWLLDAAMGSAVGKDMKIGLTIIEEENSTRTLYGLAQCTRDLDESGCSYCLQKALEVMSMDCKNHLGCSLISNCCMFRYEIYDLFLEAEAPNSGHAVSALTSNGYLH